MSTATLAHPIVNVFAGQDMVECPGNWAKPTFSKFERDGSPILKIADVPVFRSGIFRDSIGWQHEYDAFGIETMVRNFDHLTAQKILPNIPVRKGHPSFGTNRMDGLVGYVTALRHEERVAPHDGNSYEYLIADFEIIESEAQKHIESGLWRSRSSEVGSYVDNREQDYGLTFMGVAYVDIPAVEGLDGFSKELDNKEIHFAMEDDMNAGVTKNGGVIDPPTPPAAPFGFSLNGTGGVTDYAQVQNYISALEKANEEFESEVVGLREFRDTKINEERTAFVTSLIEGNVVLASKKDQLMALAKGFDAESFEIWKGTYENVGANPVLDKHGVQEDSKPDAQPGAFSFGRAKVQDTGEGVESAAFKSNVETLRALKHTSKKEEEIKAGATYKAVIAVDPTFVL